jgi:hypothetical protein
MSPLGASLAAYAKLPEPLPPAVLRIDSEQKVRDRLARQICFNDMQKFGKEMSAKGKSIDKSSARDYFEKFVKERKLTTGASAEFKDQYTMSDDPGLKSIKERHVKTHGKLANIAPMGRQFFFDRETDFMGRPSGPEKPASTYYVPTVYPNNLAPNDPNASWLGSSFVGTQTGGADTEPMLLIWRTAELPAEEPKSLDDKTRAKAIAAWKRMKARELAKAKADEIAAEAKTFGAAADVIRARLIDHQAKLKAEQKDQAAMERVRYFELDKVAPIVTVRGFQPGRDQISEFSLQRTEDMPYPTPQMVKDLLDHRDKDIPTAVVMVDNPKDMYYVAVLGAKNDRRPFEYAQGVYMPFGPMQGLMGQRVRNDFQYDSFRKNEKLLAEKSDAIE